MLPSWVVCQRSIGHFISCMCVWECVGLWEHVCVCAHARGRRLPPMFFLRQLPPYFLRQTGSFPEPGAQWFSLIAQPVSPWDPFLATLPVLRLQATLSVLSCCRSDPDSHVCILSPLPTDLFPGLQGTLLLGVFFGICHDRSSYDWMCLRRSTTRLILKYDGILHTVEPVLHPNYSMVNLPPPHGILHTTVLDY